MDAKQPQGNQTIPSRNPRPDLIEAAVKHIETLTPDAHNPYPLWHGWAIRDAFIAGHQYLLAEQPPDPLLAKITTDIQNIKTALDQYHPTTLTEVSFIQQIDKLANMVLLLATTLSTQRPIK